MDNSEKTSEYLVINRIIDVLKTINKIEGSNKYSYDEFDNYSIWNVKIKLPNENINLSYQIPLNECFFPESLNKYCFFIDVFLKNKNDNSNNILSPDQFYDFLINLNGYLSFLESDAELRTIKKLHINRHIDIVSDFNDYSEQPVDKIEDFLKVWNSNNHKPILLLGDRGMGKTWTAKKYCFDIMQKRKKEKNYWLHTPAIYVSLRKLSNDLKETKILYQAIYFTLNKTYKVKFFDDAYIFQAFVKTGNIILVLDGIDEMSIEQSLEISNRNLWELFQVIKDAKKVLLTSRISYFNSYNQIKEHFAFTKFKEILNEKDILHKAEEKSIRKDFNVWELKEFNQYEKDDLYASYSKSGNDNLIDGVKKLQNLEKGDYKVGSIEFEITELSKIPALYANMVKNLCKKQFSYISIYEGALNDAIFRFNIKTDRSLDEYIIIPDSKVNKYDKKDFSIKDKNYILKNIAWALFSKGFSSFSIDEFSRMISEFSDIEYDIIVNDLRSQTVLKVSDENIYKFLNKSVFAYYVAIYLIDLFENNKFDYFFNNLGYYNLLEEGTIGLRILSFLGSKLENKKGFKKIVISKIEQQLLDHRPFAPSNKYIFSNLKKLGINTKDIENYNFWDKYPLGSFFTSLKDIISNEFILIPSESIPFYLSHTEITNKEFLSFLNDKEFEGDFWKRYGLYWKNAKNRFKNVINAYHLLFWAKGDIPIKKDYHPVVYISWFAAAMFCNWLTYKLKIYKEDTTVYDYYYDFIPYRDNIYLKEVKINNGSLGFRLPDEDEWNFASKEGDNTYKYIWDKYLDKKDEKDEKDEKDKLLPEGIKLKNRLLKEMPATSPVRFDSPNKFGIYGLWGNVREWVNRLNIKIIGEKDYSILKGSTWLLGKDGFKIGNKEEVFAQNTNFDVGFRIAKSLTQNEIELFSSAYKEYNLLKNKS